MPELPEVEVVRRGLEREIQETPFLLRFEFRRPDLRHKIPQKKLHSLEGERIQSIQRRAKFLLFKTESAGFLSHLGMTGTWRLLNGKKLEIHDHIVMTLGRTRSDIAPKILVYRDPRRFGIFDFWMGQIESLPWGTILAPEPLTDKFNAQYLYEITRYKQRSIKAFIMDQAFVVGVGNIYASESLFVSGIRPTRAARTLTRVECELLTHAIKKVLSLAIDAGGSSISDFKSFQGHQGDYHLQHFDYDREGEACRKCHTPIRSKVLAGRSTYWCTCCQH